MKLGIEMEFWTGDEAGRLCDGADVVATHERFHLEFIDPLLEVQTTPRESESALRRELRETLAAGIEATESEARGLRLEWADRLRADVRTLADGKRESRVLSAGRPGPIRRSS